MAKPAVKRVGLAVVVLAACAQLVPVARDNPPAPAPNLVYATAPANVQRIFDESCKNCHSDQTVWPWYSYVAPVSWVVAHDVHRGRSHLNFSTWDTYPPRKREERLEAICDELEDGNMPDGKYLLIHRGARLTPQERQAVCDWVETVPN
ncbi:MAG: heme-binding domain-containing protein [Terriglobales bacterium]